MTHVKQGEPAFQRVTLALFAGGIATYASLYATQPILPLLSQAFAITPAVASLSVSAATAALSVGMIFAGPLADSLGRKPVMSFSLVATGVLGVLAAVMPAYSWLIALRALEGLVLAGLPATAMAYLSEEMDPRYLGVAMGLYISGNSVGGMGGRIVSGMIADVWNWRAAVGAIGVVSLLCAIWFWRTLPPSRHFQAQPLGVRRLAGSLAQSLADPGLLCLYAIGFVIMGSFVTLYDYISYDLMAPPYSLSAGLVGWIFLIYVVGTFSSTWMGRLSDRHGRRRVLWMGVAAELAGAVITLAAPLALKVLGIAVFTFGFFGAHSVASGWVTQRAVTNKGAASSLYLFFYYMGSSLAGTAGGGLYSAYGWPGVVALLAGLLLLGLGSAAVLARLR